MPIFPEKQADITALANTLANGLNSDPIFSSIPVTPTDVTDAIGEFNMASSLAEQKRAEAAQATTAKALKMDALTTFMKRAFGLAVDLSGITEAQLHKIGWGFPSPPSALAIPGQCRDLEVGTISGKSVEFDWKKPVSGGKASGYKLYRRAGGTMGSWTLEDALFGVASTRDEEHDFPTGTWDVVVTATNNAGEGPVSNTVSVTVA